MTVRSEGSPEDARPSFSKIKTEWSKCKSLESSCWQWSSNNIWGREVGADKTHPSSSDILSLTGHQEQTLDPRNGCLCMGRIVWLAVKPRMPRFSGWDDFACVQSRCSGNWIGKSFKKRKGDKFGNVEKTPQTCIWHYPSGTSDCSAEVSGLLS